MFTLLHINICTAVALTIYILNFQKKTQKMNQPSSLGLTDSRPKTNVRLTISARLEF